MRKVLTALVLLAPFGLAHAGSGENQLFDCMDKKTFELNSQCIATNISNNIRFRDAQQQMTQKISADNGEYAVATMTFDQEKMSIDIVAHKDALLVLNNQ